MVGIIIQYGMYKPTILFLKSALYKDFIFFLPVSCKKPASEAMLVSPLKQPPRGAVSLGVVNKKMRR